MFNSLKKGDCTCTSVSVVSIDSIFFGNDFNLVEQFLTFDTNIFTNLKAFLKAFEHVNMGPKS